MTCSINRLLYPHSLSYQAKTLTMSPSTTCVKDKSTIDDSDRPMMSDETSDSLDTASIPFRRDSLEATSSAVFTSSTVVDLLSKNVKSAIEPQATGTRKHTPSNLPFNWGITSVV